MSPTAEIAEPLDRASRLTDLITIAKPRIALMVALSTGAGYYLASPTFKLMPLLHTLLGVLLAAAGSSALNMVWERDLDARMNRTRERPLPSGRMTPRDVMLLGLLLSTVGSVYLWLAVGPLCAVLTVGTVLGYALVYTPLKTRTSLCTVVGAIPGALPPVIGWAAAQGQLGIGGWALFAIIFLWQIPHFLAIAWIYREDYRAAGMPMLPVLDPKGQVTGRQMVLYCIALIIASLTPGLVGLGGELYFIGALLLGLAFTATALRFSLSPMTATARTVFIFSLIYLPALLALLALDKQAL